MDATAGSKAATNEPTTTAFCLSRKWSQSGDELLLPPLKILKKIFLIFIVIVDVPRVFEFEKQETLHWASIMIPCVFSILWIMYEFNLGFRLVFKYLIKSPLASKFLDCWSSTLEFSYFSTSSPCLIFITIFSVCSLISFQIVVLGDEGSDDETATLKKFRRRLQRGRDWMELIFHTAVASLQLN